MCSIAVLWSTYSCLPVHFSVSRQRGEISVCRSTGLRRKILKIHSSKRAFGKNTLAHFTIPGQTIRDFSERAVRCSAIVSCLLASLIPPECSRGPRMVFVCVSWKNLRIEDGYKAGPTKSRVSREFGEFEKEDVAQDWLGLPTRTRCEGGMQGWQIRL